VAKTARLPKAFWAWDEIIEMNQGGYWPYTPSTNLLYGLSEALDMVLEQGLPVIFERHQRWSRGVRAAVQAWGLPTQCADERVHSPVLTGVITPQGGDADALRRLIHQPFDLSLGSGLGKLRGRMFRIGHPGDCNDLTLMAALTGIEMGFKLAGVPARCLPLSSTILSTTLLTMISTKPKFRPTASEAHWPGPARPATAKFASVPGRFLASWHPCHCKETNRCKTP